jgi:hypothetical protein
MAVRDRWSGTNLSRESLPSSRPSSLNTAATRLRRFVLTIKRIHFFPPEGKRGYKNSKYKSQYILKSEKTLFNPYIIRSWLKYPRIRIFSGTKM